jgi:hypothetical protein
MCKKSQAEATILRDRTRGLDARGNVGVNTQAESNWAVATLSGLDNDALDLLDNDLKRIYAATHNRGDNIKAKASKFHKGFERFYGKDGSGQPSAQDLVGLMLENEYDWKSAVDYLAGSDGKANKALQDQCRKKPEFDDRGRIQGRTRQNSFVNPHAGITDRMFREEGTENIFGKEVVHAKGFFEGDPKSATYQKFAKQGAPFIAGVSGTMQGLAMSWEIAKPLNSIKDQQQQDAERSKREKTAGIYMATLLAGGHHSASELLFSAKSYGLFPDVADPLTNYPQAMQELGTRFKQLGLPGDLSPKPGGTWRSARKAVADSLAELRTEITDVYKTEAYANALGQAFMANVVNKLAAVFTNDLADKLDNIADFVSDADKPKREKAMKEAGVMIKQARKQLDANLVTGLDENPFRPMTVRKTLSAALDQVAGLAR